MASKEADELEGHHYSDAVAFGFVGSFLLWLAIGESLLVKTVWMPIALAFILAMLYRPEPGATVAKLVCAGAGYPPFYLLMGLMALMRGAIAYTFPKTIVEAFPRWLQVLTLGYPELKPHDPRHGVAMEVLEQHHDLEQVRALLGHARIDTTQIYTSIRPPQLKRAVSFYEEKAVQMLGQ